MFYVFLVPISCLVKFYSTSNHSRLVYFLHSNFVLLFFIRLKIYSIQFNLIYFFLICYRIFFSNINIFFSSIKLCLFFLLFYFRSFRMFFFFTYYSFSSTSSFSFSRFRLPVSFLFLILRVVIQSNYILFFS